MTKIRGLKLKEALSLSPFSEKSGSVRSPSQRTLMYVDFAVPQHHQCDCPFRNA